jgi:hypothetical protein
MSLLLLFTPSGPYVSDETWRFALVNSFSEVPPMAHYPRKERVTTDWSETGTSYVQHAWTDSRLTKYLVSANEQLQLWDDTSSTQITSTVGSPPSGWFIASHELATDNDEVDYRIQAASTVIATVRPWHGFLASYGLAAEATGVCVVHDKNMAQKHAVAGINSDGKLTVSLSANVRPYVFDTVIHEILPDWISIYYRRPSSGQGLTLLTIESGNVYLRTSTDDGITFSMATTVDSSGTNTHTFGFASDFDGKQFIFWIDGSAIKGKIYDAAMNVLTATFTAVASGVENAGFSAWERVIESGKRTISIAYINTSGATIIVEADDEQTFS